MEIATPHLVAWHMEKGIKIMAVLYALIGILVLALFVVLLLALSYIIIVLFELVAEEVSDLW